jgi:TolA-binding protein
MCYKKIKSIAFFLLFLHSFLFAEDSLYGFGSDYDVNEMADNTPPHRRTLDDLYQKVQNQEERIDGLISIIEGLNTTIEEMKNSKKDIKVTQILDEINQNFVRKEEVKGLLSQPIQNKAVKKQVKDSLTKAEHYTKGVKLFLKKRYTQAKIHFVSTQKQNYKPAGSNYYLGEIAYFSHQYQDAIYHFKKSVGLYAQAPYLDTLLLHTAISFEKTSDKAQAKAFYENIIENYPEKKTAKIAKKRLENL